MSIEIAKQYCEQLKLRKEEREEVENVIAGYMADCVSKDKRIDFLEEHLERLRGELKKERDENAVLKVGLLSVRQLMNDSYGVDGLHENGDVAPWDELEQGGRFEEWLYAFNRAENV